MARMRLDPGAARLRAGFAAIRTELGVPEAFPPDVLAEAAAARPDGTRTDRTGVALVTIDPPGSRDLDQAYGAVRRGDGYRLSYAISDPGAFVRPGGALDAESRRRGVTLYSPDLRTPLYPESLSEGRASLLPGQDTPSVLWTIDLDDRAEPVAVRVERAAVRSRAQLDYPTVQRGIDGGTADEPLLLLREIGTKRQQREAERGGVSLRAPNQEVVSTDGGYALAFVAPLPAEDWNAQVSLLTGMCAARIMLDGGIGLLRTMPPPWAGAVNALRHSARALRVPWPGDESYASFIRRLDPAVEAQAVLLDLARTLLRGAGYAAFDGTPPADANHSAIAAPYAHATAPLRRLADRFVNETVLALHEGSDVPDWCRATLPLLPELMAAAEHRDHALERAVVDYVEAAMLAPRVGERFDAFVTEVDEKSTTVQVCDPAVRARLDGHADLGAHVTVWLTEADPATRRVRYSTSPPDSER